jgi:F-type H+-transporting ATPase subunit gamma
LAFNEFHSAILQKPKIEKLLPLQLNSVLDSTGDTQTLGKIFLYEPGPTELLEKLLPMLIEFQIYRALLESFASEHAARMAAMDSASNNARDMIGRLTLKMNRARQAAITKELMEIIGGAEAIAS